MRSAKSLLTILITLACCFAAFPTPQAFAQTQNLAELKAKFGGVWVRMDDAFEGTIMKVEPRAGDLQGVLVYTPPAIEEAGFRIGDVKNKKFTILGEDDYEAESKLNTHRDGIAIDTWYARDIIYLRKNEEMIFRQKRGAEVKVGAWQRWVRINSVPSYLGNYHFGEGLLAEKKKDGKQALEHYLRALKQDADDPRYLNAMAWRLATDPSTRVRNGELAVKVATRACEETNFNNGSYLDTLAASYAESGKFDQAVNYQLKANRTFYSTPADYVGRLQLYRSKRAYQEGVRLPAAPATTYESPVMVPSGGSPIPR